MRDNKTSPMVYIGVLLVTLIISGSGECFKNSFFTGGAPGGRADPGGICPEGCLSEER